MSESTSIILTDYQQLYHEARMRFLSSNDWERKRNSFLRELHQKVVVGDNEELKRYLRNKREDELNEFNKAWISKIWEKCFDAEKSEFNVISFFRKLAMVNDGQIDVEDLRAFFIYKCTTENIDNLLRQVLEYDTRSRSTINAQNIIVINGEVVIKKEETSDSLLKYNPGKTFGGILAEVENRKEDELTNGDIFYVCGIEDPFNLGYIIRNLYVFGVNNIILDKRDYSTMDSQILKSSAGAYDFINVKYSDNVSELINSLKDKGYKVYALSREEDSKDIFDTTFNKPSLIIIGGEKRGISAKVMETVDEKVFIPYGNNFRNSLNAANALACVATLLFKQRK